MRATAILIGTFLFAACGDDDGGTAEVLMCTPEGACSCDEDTRTCTCTGGSTCALDGASDVTLQCDGNAACNLDCGMACEVICPGTTGCTSTIGDESSGVCQGTGSCDFTCEADCSVSCSGTSSCIVHCADGARCDRTECRGEVDCGGGVFTCGGATCPAMM